MDYPVCSLSVLLSEHSKPCGVFVCRVEEHCLLGCFCDGNNDGVLFVELTHSVCKHENLKNCWICNEI
jgi:hypothetical protein